VKGDTGVITKMESSSGWATYTNEKGVKTTGWLDLCDLICYFAQTPTLQFNTVAKNDTFFFDATHQHFIAYDLTFTYPVYYKDGDLAKLQQQFIAGNFGDKYKKIKPADVLQTFWTTSSSEYNDAEMKEIIAEWDADKSMYAVTYDIVHRNTLLRLEGNLLQYVDNSFYYTGGAHGSAATKYHIIDLRTGKPVLYKDIFKENATDAVTKLIITDYLKQRKWQALDEYASESNFASPDNIRMEDTGLTFHYGQYAVASYADGVWDMFVPYNQLLPYIKTDSPVYEIAKEL
jgi:hypothetical protein